MTKHKGRKHAGELVDALCWVREINDQIGNKEGFNSERLVKLEFIPYGDSDFFEIRYLGDLIFFPGDNTFDPEQVEGMLWDKVNAAAKSLGAGRRVLAHYLDEKAAKKPKRRKRG